MDPIHRQVLANMTTVIMNRISSPTVFAAYLKRIFSPSDIEEIKAKEIQMGAIQGAQTLLSLLEKRGPKAFVLFKDALRNPGNNMADLADELEAEEGRLRGKTGKTTFSLFLYLQTSPRCDKAPLHSSQTFHSRTIFSQFLFPLDAYPHPPPCLNFFTCPGEEAL